MVDQFSGDFSYAIPLMDVEGYPITISYNSNVGMMDEASWVGLGWNLNVGSVAREMRGVPDEFDGSQNISRIYSVLPENTENGWKAGLVGGFTLGYISSRRTKFGTDISVLLGGYDNPYTGHSRTFDFNLSASLTTSTTKENEKTKTSEPGLLSGGFGGGFGYSSDSKNGIGRSSSFGVRAAYGDDDKGPTGSLGLNYGSNFHSRAGVTQRSISGNAAFNMNTKYQAAYRNKNGNYSVGEFRRSYGAGSPFGSSFTCGTPTSVPRIEMSTTGSSSQWVFDLTWSYGNNFKKFKGASWGYTVGLETQVYHSEQELVYANNTSKLILNPAYGYFHSAARENYAGTDQPVMDFNRERDGQLSSETKNLPFSFPTYDVFYVNGMGMSATFRGQRNDAGAYQDGRPNNEVKGSGKNISAGLEFTPASTTTLSLSTGFVYTDQESFAESGKWENDTERFVFGSDDHVFFKGIGEPTPKNTALFDHLQGEKPAYLKLGTIDGANPTITKGQTIVYEDASSDLVPATLTAAQAPDTRANIYRPLLASEMGTTDENHRIYPLNGFLNPAGTAFTRIDGGSHLGTHVSGIEVLTSGGMKYSYALPVYSLSQSEVVFSTESAEADGLVSYAGSTDNSINNSKGRAHLYDKTTVPAYATSFLLTGVTSGDYVDLTGNGYTIDDIGDYYKINYSRPYDVVNPFKWRFPANQEKAFHNEGLLATDLDNMAMYTYGEKEIWYTHSVESKNMIAEFTLADREDVVSVATENGGLNPNAPLKCLSKITLYNRSERISQGANAKPLQIVEFIYDYSLCPGVPTSINGGGKLTLKEIRVYSGAKSEETALHPYKFSYTDASGNPENNPSFGYEHSDRWGNYTTANSTAKPIELYPYAEQNETTADKNVKAWKLKKIELPMGSEMEIAYEADSYRYVQNQRVMKHLDIKGYTDAFHFADLMEQNSWNGIDGVGTDLVKKLTVTDVSSLTGLPQTQVLARNGFYTTQVISGNLAITDDKALYSQYDQLPCNIVVFKLDQAIPAMSKADADVLFRETYLKSDQNQAEGFTYLKELYLRNFVQVKENSAYELVPTFARIRQNKLNLDVPGYDPIAATGVMPPTNGIYEYGYIILENVLSIEATDKLVPIAMSPVQKTALEFARLHLTDIVYGSCATCEGDITIDRKAFWRGGDLYRVMAKGGYMKQISQVNPSQLRLYDHDNKKIGGNARVKQITIRDKWDAISGESGTEYYWRYDYDRSGYGVAAYEPASGNDENPLYAWDRFTNKALSFPDESRFTVKPIGESVFPAPVVGYSAVEVSMNGNKVSSNTNLGYSVASFLTAYNYPSSSRSTVVQKVEAGKTTAFKTEIDLYGLSQGHSVVTNNFHGQPSDYRIYNAQGDLQARTTYTYKTPGASIQMLDRSGALSDRKVAMECDIYADARFITNRSEIATIGLNVSFPLAPLPSFIPNGFSPVLNRNVRKTGYYTHVLNKHIHYSAIVESVVTETMGSVNTAKDLVYDKETGVVLLSSLTDEYEDELFAFSYPAYWYYSLFRNPLEQPAVPVTGTITSGAFTASGLLTDKFTVGDLVSVTTAGTTTQAYVLSVSGNSAKLINTTNFQTFGASGASTVALVKSGRKNILTAVMQSVVTKRNPVNGNTFTFPVADILSASAMTLRPRVNVLCREYGGSQPISVAPNAVINPFHYGLLNNLVLQHSLAPQLERNTTQTQGVRFNGAYIGYVPYYTIAASGEWVHEGDAGYTLGNGNWRSAGEYTVLDEYGRPLESTDAIYVPSAVLYGYNRYNKLIPVAQAVNAKQHEIAYDSFDDYSYMQGDVLGTGAKGHFDYFEAIQGKEAELSGTRHSGLKSLQVNAGASAKASRKVTPPLSCSANSFSGSQYQVDPCMCVKGFEPQAGSEYVLGLWVQGRVKNAAGNYTDSYVTVECTTPGGLVSVSFYPKGQTLDGWQRIEETFTVPVDATAITVLLINGNTQESGVPVFFDDLRIHPFLAGMTTVVYDPETLLPLATHDGYNYTTFYGYDENLAPVRVRVETMNGIQTISESEGSSLPKFKN